jgi:hypothetical protein
MGLVGIEPYRSDSILQRNLAILSIVIYQETQLSGNVQIV